MIAGGRVLALIPARGGSKRLPRKNLRELAGVPLIGWSIAAARNSRHVDRIVVSSDDPEIIEVAGRLGAEAPFRRPAEISDDAAPTMAAVTHALAALPGFDYLVLLQPTSPLRTAADIEAALARSAGAAGVPCVSLVAAKPAAWHFRIAPGNRVQPLAAAEAERESEPLFVLNGAVYAASTAWLARRASFLAPETLAYVMPRSRSIDIDDEEDFAVAETLLAAAKSGG